MAEIRSGLRSFLSRALPYNLLQRAVGADRAYAIFLRKAGILPHDRVLDIGCGTAEILAFLPPVDYVGVDSSDEYIEAARRRYGDRGTFICQRAGQMPAAGLGDFHHVLALSTLHHLEDDEVRHLLRVARASLRPLGRLTTLDPCYAEDQSPLARWMLDLDRGRNIRNEAGYAALAREVFSRVETSIHHNALRIPYTHLIMSCSAGPAGGDRPQDDEARS